ncbi:unnamed protein product [marine sediment metagenome]|uniref:Uncharacterized protein n=1 Tax=marine sediment metagenome TaxID=412755 RepID=X1J807_9ZZZZ
MSITRSTVIGYMRAAFRKKQTVSAFREDMRRKGLSYRWTTMLSDWRTVNEIEAKKGLMRFVRKDRYPTKLAIAEVDWLLSQEYMYTVKVQSRLRPDEPEVARFVNLMSDEPMTAAMIEQAIPEKWAEWEDYTAEAIEKIIPWSAAHRVAL